jgi:hypothetical protein
MKLRDDLCESIVEMSLYYSRNRGCDLAKLKNIAAYDLKITLEPLVLKAALERLIEKKIAVKKGDQFFLSDHKIKEIEKILALRKQSLKDMETEFTGELRKRYANLTSDQEKLGVQLLYEFLSLFYSTESKLVSASLRLSPEDVKFLTSYKPPIELLENLLSKIDDKQLAKSIEAAISSLFKSKKLSRFLQITAKNFLFFEILNLDPACRLLEKEAFSRKNLFLDTNFLIALLLPSEPRHVIAVQTAILSEKIGARLIITKRTEEEFRDELEHANDRFRKLNCNKLDILMSLDDYFITSFAQEKEKKPMISWNDFYLKMKPFRSILNRYGVTLFDDNGLSLQVLNSKIFPEITGYALTCAQKVARKIKSTNVAQHDAYHILLIRELRKNQTPDMFGPQYWLLTFDNSLLCVDKAVNELLGNRYEAPSSMMSWVWFELISSYFGAVINEDTMSRAFASLMRSPLSAMPAKLNIEELMEIQNPKINLDNYSVEELQEILGDEFVQRYIKKVRTARFEHSPKLEEYQKELQEHVEKKSNAVLQKRVRVREEIFWRRISGISSVVILLCGIICAILNNLQGAILLFSFASFFMALAVGYRTIEIGLKRLGIRIRKT